MGTRIIWYKENDAETKELLDEIDKECRRCKMKFTEFILTACREHLVKLHFYKENSSNGD